MKFLIIVLPLIYAQISVYYPESLKRAFPKGITGSLGNFGNPPYDTTIIGHVWHLSTKGCSPIQEENPFAGILNTIVMVERGDCAFVVKVKNAQDVGAKAVIIIDNRDEDITKVIMRDNGLGGNLYIPAYLISKQDGVKVIDAVKTSNNLVSLVLSFDMPTLASSIYLDMWISSDNTLSLKFLEEFAPIGKLLNHKNADFTPHYVFISDLTSAANGYNTPVIDCLGGGRYCCPDPDGGGPLTGRMVVQEDLRQICMFKEISEEESYARWFTFQQEFAKRCGIKNFNEECSTGIMEELGFDLGNIKKCYEKSFSKGKSSLTDTNDLLDHEVDFWRNNGLHYYPALIINGQLYRGDMENSAVLLGLCAGYQQKYQPEFCKPDFVPATEGYSTKTVVITLGTFFVVIAIVLFVYRHIAKKEMETEMKMQVNQAVSQYFALSDTSTFKKNNRQVVKADYV